MDLDMDYKDFFKTAFNKEPYNYQTEIAQDVFPSVINAPTGAGKTAMILGAWLWRRIRESNLEKEKRVGRRLIYCLPMRVLVEQTAKVAQDAVQRLEEAGVVEKGRFRVYVLMGGETADEWDSNPEREYIIVGTQDMLLSRALNRGYAMSRYRWPVHFGLLNNDCLWVFDEVQLMGSGLATSVQLQAFRRLFGAFGPVKTLWMSATVDRDWLKTADCDLDQDVQGVRSLNLERENSETLRKVIYARKKLQSAGVEAQDTEKLAKKVLKSHKAGSRTLVIVNTVPRAVELYQTLKEKIEDGRHEQGREKRSVPAVNTPELVLIHSRFRPCERKERVEKLLAEPKEGGTIIVSTQVVEAGVDVSAQTLFTELAPWSSLVQRFGRCNRRGEYEEAEIFWIDVKDADAAPYNLEDLKRARRHLKVLEGKDASPKELARYIEGLCEKERRELLTFEHVYVIRPHDLHGLFSTEPDLAGGFTDVSNFVRNIEGEADVYVYWREFKDKPAKDEPLPRRDELCPVRFFRLKDLLGKSSVAWMWNAEERAWKALRADEIKPGMTLLLSASQGGYDPELGWTGESGDKPGVIEDETSSNALMINAQESLDDDQLSETDWVGLPEHLKDAEAEAKEIVSAITLDDDGIWKQCYPNVIRAAWWHDVGKALPRWQRSGKDQLHQIKEKSEEFLKKNPDGPEADFIRRFLEKLKELESDGEFWAKFPGLEQSLRASGLSIETQKRIKKAIAVPFLPGLRHEAASALAAWQKWRKGTDGWTALAVYLVACHHGKVRTVLRSTQKKRKAAAAQTQNPTYTAEQREDEIPKEIFGITSEELLPKLSGWLEEDTSLDLRLSVFGAVGKWDADSFEIEEPSWIQMVAELLGPEIPGELVVKDAIPEKEPRELGPFRLAFLEALIRAADVKASQVPGRLRRDRDE
jgi:CRISPR-associated endonuclease/helicase Cas3